MKGKMRKIVFSSNSVIVLAIVTIIFLWAIFPKVYVFSDPTAYLILANDILSMKDWEFNHPFEHRLMLLFSHWISYSLLGVDVFYSFLPQLIFYLGLTVLVLNQCSGVIAKLYASAVLVLLLPQATSVFPDLGAATFMFLAILFLQRRSRIISAIAFALCAFIAFLFKLTAVFIAVPYIYYLLRDLIAKQPMNANTVKFHATVLIASMLCLAIYLAFMAFVSGNPLSRLSTVNEFNHLWEVGNFKSLFSRLFLEPPVFFVTYTGFTFFLAVCGCIVSIRESRADRHIAEYLIFSVLLFVFASSSISIYNPLPLIDRMMAFIVPPMAVVAANFVPQFTTRLTQNERTRQLLTAFVLLAAVYWSVLPSVRTAVYNIDHIHFVRDEIAQIMRNDDESVLIVAEARTAEMIDIHFSFDRDLSNRTVVCPVNEDNWANNRSIVLIDRHRAGFLGSAYGQITCVDELKNWTMEKEFEVLEDSERYFFAINHSIRQ